jgi:hypothetical protein
MNGPAPEDGADWEHDFDLHYLRVASGSDG